MPDTSSTFFTFTILFHTFTKPPGCYTVSNNCHKKSFTCPWPSPKLRDVIHKRSLMSYKKLFNFIVLLIGFLIKNKNSNFYTLVFLLSHFCVQSIWVRFLKEGEGRGAEHFSVILPSTHVSILFLI